MIENTGLAGLICAGHPQINWTSLLLHHNSNMTEAGGHANLTEYGASRYGETTPDYRKVSSNLEGENTSSEQTQSLNIKYEINDAFELTSVTARRFYDDESCNDFDYTSATLSHTYKDNKYTTLSQELRLNYNNGGVKWIAGRLRR